MPSKEEIKEFQVNLFNWWNINKRDLPWRKTDNPYHILVSEFMLQQTQVGRVIPRYLRFLKRFPSVSELSKAKPASVIEEWQGLGYNRRALWLQTVANNLVQLDEFPRDWKTLLKFKGIGPYTARSIPIFAFNANYAAIDTNIKRIYKFQGWIDEDMKPKEIQNLGDRIVPKGKSRDFHNALMDYGSLKITSTKIKNGKDRAVPKFEGSKRQIRGKVIKLLIQDGILSDTELLSKMDDGMKIDLNLLLEVISDLTSDGLIQGNGNLFQLPE